MVKFKSGFYWNELNKNRYSLVYCENPAHLVSRRLIRVHNFDESGTGFGYVTKANKLTPFDPEKDMDRLEPKVAEKVKLELEEIAKEAS